MDIDNSKKPTKLSTKHCDSENFAHTSCFAKFLFSSQIYLKAIFVLLELFNIN